MAHKRQFGKGPMPNFIVKTGFELAGGCHMTHERFHAVIMMWVSPHFRLPGFRVPLPGSLWFLTQFILLVPGRSPATFNSGTFRFEPLSANQTPHQLPAKERPVIVISHQNYPGGRISNLMHLCGRIKNIREMAAMVWLCELLDVAHTAL